VAGISRFYRLATFKPKYVSKPSRHSQISNSDFLVLATKIQFWGVSEQPPHSPLRDTVTRGIRSRPVQSLTRPPPSNLSRSPSL
jgi:hypothetical protein